MEIRIWLPDTLAGWRYCLRHPKSFIIGRYGFKAFIRQRDMILSLAKQRNDLQEKVVKITTELIEVRKELSALKRKGKESKL